MPVGHAVGEHGGSGFTVGGVNRRILTLLVALVPIVAFGVLLSVVTVPFVSLGPGPTFNTLGEVEGKQVVDIKSTEGPADLVHPTSGHLNMTTVSQRDGLTLGQALALWMSGREQLVPRDLVYPPDKSKNEIDEANNSDFAVRGQRRVRGAVVPEVPGGGDRAERHRSGPLGGQAARR